MHITTLLICTLHASTKSILTDLESAEEDLKSGRIHSALQSLEVLYRDNSDKQVVLKSYISMLYKTGKYKEVVNLVDKHGITTQPLDIKEMYVDAKSNVGKIKNMAENAEILYKVSPWSLDVLLALARKYMGKKMFTESFEVVQKAMKAYPHEKQFKRLNAHLSILRGEYEKGLAEFNKLDERKTVFNDLRNSLARLKQIKGIADKRSRLHYLEILDKDITVYKFSDHFIPSLFYNVKLEVLTLLVSLGVSLNMRGVSKKARELIQYKDGENERYLLINCLINDSDLKEAELEYSKCKFKDLRQKQILEARIDNLKNTIEEERRQEERRKEKAEEKEREKREKRERENQKQREYQYRQSGAGQNNDPDPKGYYKTLESTKADTAAKIRKNYYKLVKKNNPDPYMEKDKKKYKELTDKLMGINEAKAVLLDEEKRKLYDSGMLDEQRAGNQFQGGSANFEDVFKVFFGNQGGFFGGSQGGNYQQYGNSQRGGYTYSFGNGHGSGQRYYFRA